MKTVYIVVDYAGVILGVFKSKKTAQAWIQDRELEQHAEVVEEEVQ